MTRKTRKNAPALLTALRDLLSAHSKVAGGDISPMLNKEHSFFYVDAQTANAIATWGIESQARDCFATDRNPKVCKRFAQFVNAVNAKNFKNIDATTIRGLYALRAAGGSLTRDALYNLLTGKVKVEGVSPETKGVGLRQLDALGLNRVGRGTAETQISRTFGANGFARFLGMVTSDARVNPVFTLDLSHPLTQEVFALVDNANAAQIAEMVGEE